jgi:hypothetical protein
VRAKYIDIASFYERRMHVTAQSTNLESVPATNNHQQQQSSASESVVSGSNLNSSRSKKTTATTSSLLSSVDGIKQQQQQHGTTNLDDEVSYFVYNFFGLTKSSLFIIFVYCVY